MHTIETLPSAEPITLPRGFMPKSDKVGLLPSKKIMAFEGARYWNGTSFDFSTDPNGTGLIGTPQGNFLSRGSAFMGSGENYARTGGGASPSDIFKKISLRHSGKMNAGMFDGHVELLDNEQSADPTYFCPSGTTLRFPAQTWYFTVGPATSPLHQVNAVIP
jgi:prepilin-type processing-associated H-X9-DG protein